MPEGALTPLRRLKISAEARPGAWFNDAESFKLATATAFEAREQARVACTVGVWVRVGRVVPN